jgi:acetyl-CoA carboxylase alpha subunit
VIAPEAATAILKRAPADVPAVASDLRISPRELLELGVVAGIAGDEPVEEPAPGAASSPRPVESKEVSNAR